MNEFFSQDEIIALTDFPEGRYFERAPEYGDRAWIVEGRRRTLIVWDEGNGWYSILTQLTKTSIFQRPTDIELKLAGKIWGLGLERIKRRLNDE